MSNIVTIGSSLQRAAGAAKAESAAPQVPAQLVSYREAIKTPFALPLAQRRHLAHEGGLASRCSWVWMLGPSYSIKSTQPRERDASMISTAWRLR